MSDAASHDNIDRIPSMIQGELKRASELNSQLTSEINRIPIPIQEAQGFREIRDYAERLGATLLEINRSVERFAQRYAEPIASFTSSLEATQNQITKCLYDNRERIIQRMADAMPRIQRPSKAPAKSDALDGR